MKRTNILLILLILWTFIGYSQTAALDKFCMDYLGERANSLKVKTYAVRIDEMEGGVVVLKKEQETIKGVLYFPKEKKALQMRGSDAILYLRDKQGFDHGEIAYSIEDDQFTGAILSSLEQKTSTIKGAFTEDVPVIPPACYVDKWLNYQQGTLGEETVHLYLERIGNGDIQGLMYLPNYKIGAFVSGIIVDGVVDLMVTSNAGIKMGQITGRLKKDHFNALYTDQKGIRKKIKSTSIISDNLSCYSDITQNFRYSIIYPKLEVSSFDDTMDQRANDWIKTLEKEKTKNKSSRHNTLLNAPSAYSFVDLHCRDERYFSGYQIAYLPNNHTYTTHALNFDLRKKSFIQMDDLFISSPQIKAMVRVAFQKKLATHTLKENPDFKKWIRTESFDNFVIQPDGILFSSNFHPVFGQQHVLFPYLLLKPYLKSKKIYKYFRKLK